jgi:hypothetical protein
MIRMICLNRGAAFAAGMVLGFLLPFPGTLPGPVGDSGIVLAAESLKLDSLSSDPRQFRAQVDQALAKAAALIEKLKGHPNARAAVLDLMQTRDNVLRELPKIEGTPGDAKWGSEEMRDSVKAMLMLLKEQYDKAAGIAG